MLQPPSFIGLLASLSLTVLGTDVPGWRAERQTRLPDLFTEGGA